MTPRLFDLLLASIASAAVAGVFLGPAPLVMQIAIAVTIALAIWRPADAAVAVAVAAPLGGAFAALSHAAASWATPLVLAFVAGASLREAIDPRQPRDRTATVVVAVWIAIVLLSATLEVAAQRPRELSMREFLRAFTTWLFWLFPMGAPHLYAGVSPAALAVAGAALFLVIARLCARDPRLAGAVTRALLLSVATLGALNVNRLIEAALRRPPFLPSLIELHHSIRISATFPDFNAAGALFLLLLPAAFTLLTERRDRWLAVAAIPCLLAGLWLAGSRSALVMLPLALIGLVLWRLRVRPDAPRHSRLALALIGGVIVVSLAVLAAYPRAAAHGTVSGAVEVREDLLTTTFRMIRKEPLLGVGIGDYYNRSPEFMPARLRQTYSAQNAHNQFLQVMGELGIPGFVVFAALVGIGVLPASKALARHTGDALTAGMAIATLAFLTVSLTMHPLLIPEVAVTFYIVLGATRALGIASLARSGGPSRGN